MVVVMSQLTPTAIKEFKTGFAGSVLLPDNPQYDEVRQIWNAMIDRGPSMVARCTSPADVVHALNFVRQHSVPFSLRGGGHNIAGNAVCNEGVMIDFSPMKKVDIDQQHHQGHVEPGCTLAEFDTAAQAYGLATPLGINSTTGVAGLTLGGGFGWLSRKYGLTVDNLLGVDVITADGQPNSYMPANQKTSTYSGGCEAGAGTLVS